MNGPVRPIKREAHTAKVCGLAYEIDRAWRRKCLDRTIELSLRSSSYGISNTVVVLLRDDRIGRSLLPELSCAKQQSKMVRLATYFGMSLGAFVFWKSMDKIHVWIALHQDEKKERLEKEAEIRRVRDELLAKQKESLA
ncbi:hypothetical protein HS088_TW10G00114 [Tripterygium wilfordii]|uniref:Uncharacterized protein n=2 Tax=Tripterygium wilfordii TaxID=458696 RepID=A0A7J7D4D1_TRIWF|nr:hypothetical protein HS088_TW10G00114 [Tripterygium wilfordii]